MKKFIIGIICFAMMYCICGCSLFTTNMSDNSLSTTQPQNNTVETTEQIIEPTTQPEELPVAQAPMISVSVPITTETESAEDGTIIFKYSYQNISLILPDPDVADKIIVDFLNRIDESNEQAESLRNTAKNDYASGNLTTAYMCQNIYEPERIDRSVLSLFGRYVSYSGSAHPETLYKSVNYDLITGEVLDLSDIINPEFDAEKLCQIIIDNLNSQDNLQLYNGFESMVEERFADGLSAEKYWYFSAQGLCFIFSPYEIAPYASGVVIAQIPYSQLAGILEDSYFPAELEKANGSIFISSYDEENLENYSQFSEVIINQDGEKLLIYTDKSVYDLRLNAGFQDSAEKAYTAFAAYALTPGDAVAVQFPALSEATLAVSYRTDNETLHTRNIQYSPEGKSPFLTTP